MPDFQQWADHPERKSIRKTGLEPNGSADTFSAFHPTAAEHILKCTENILQDKSDARSQTNLKHVRS